VRLISRKIWRAFPELDRYDDEACRLYVRQARSLSNVGRGALLVILSLPVTAGIWYLVLRLLGRAASGFLSGDTVQEILGLVISLGIVWCPIVCALVVRDFWLRHCLKKQIMGTACACGYSLIGLQIGEDDAREPIVMCPECGLVSRLSDINLRPQDINPELLTKS